MYTPAEKVRNCERLSGSTCVRNLNHEIRSMLCTLPAKNVTGQDFCVEQLISELPLPGAARREFNLITVTGLPRDRTDNYALSELFLFYRYRLSPPAN